MKVALVHDWTIHMRGGEKVLESFAELYPNATLYTLFYDKVKLSAPLQKIKVKPSFLHYLPGIKKYYRWLLPILPLVIRLMRVKDADVVLSSSHCVAKAIRIPKKAKHFCYCHTPMRYIWGYEEEYFGKFPSFARPFIGLILKWVRFWDLRGNRYVDAFIANADNVRKRIKKYYNRDATVIYPPLDTNSYLPGKGEGDYYLVVSAFVPYKRVDLVIETFNELDRKLIIVGSGPMEASYKELAQNSRIEFRSGLSDSQLQELYSNARATLFPTEEDFGIVPLESQACGTPVIALGAGGALESVKTGLFFEKQSVDSLKNAILKFEENPPSRKGIADKVQSFSKNEFKKQIKRFVEQNIH